MRQRTYANDILEDMDYEPERRLHRDNYVTVTPAMEKIMIRKMRRRMADDQSDTWLKFESHRKAARAGKSYWMFMRNSRGLQLTDDMLMTNAVNDWRRARRIKLTGEGNIPGQPSLDNATYALACEILYQEKKEALSKQTTE